MSSKRYSDLEFEAMKTLGDYRDFCATIAAEDSTVIKFFDNKIKSEPKGRDTQVIANESQMLAIIGSLLKQ